MAQTSRRTHPSNARRSKTSNNRLLVVVDESSSSKSAVEYVARMLHRRRGFQLCLAHFLPPLPPSLLEFGGAEDPNKERRLDAQLKTEQQQWIAAARKKAEPALDWARARLRKAGLPAASLTTQFSDPASEQNRVSEEILELARRNKCHSIVVGRRSVSWLRRITAAKDLAERLVQQGRHLTLWIVE
ncbi:MAG: universal stress protein [Candidatus Sulfotelmatobacter sp.]